MDSLRYSLMAPAGATVVMTLGCFHAMLEMIKTRYAAKDDNGKPLLPHPYTPWTPMVAAKNQEKADDAYRAFKMFENVKEWTLLSLPLMWTFWLYAGSLPFVSDAMADGAVAVSSLVYMVATYWYTVGYMESPEKRLNGFRVRRRVCEFWLFGCSVSFLWALGSRIVNGSQSS